MKQCCVFVHSSSTLPCKLRVCVRRPREFASRNFYVRKLEVDVTRQETVMVLVCYSSDPGAGSWAAMQSIDLLILRDV